MADKSSWARCSIGDLAGKHNKEIDSYLTYASRLVRRGLICNTLGNIAMRIHDEQLPGGQGLLTKPRGISLEEVGPQDLIVTHVSERILYSGVVPPSGGHRMNQRIALIQESQGTNAIIHTHPDVVIGLLSQLDPDEFKFIAIDTQLILGGPPKLFSYGINPESDADQMEESDLQSSCMLMPNHGVTTVGRSISEAYHRHTSIVAEARRYLLAMLTAGAHGRPVRATPREDTDALYQISSTFLYGDTSAEIDNMGVST